MSEAHALPRDTRVVVLSQFVTAFSWTYVYVFLPFYIQEISPYDREATLLWTGWILGVTGLASTIFAPIWGGMAARISPKRLYEMGMLLQAGFMALMGATTSLPLLLLLRFLIGCIGGLSTIALIIVSASSARENITGDVGLFQAALTSGQIAGPIAGAFSAETLGYRATFVAGAVLILIAFLNVRLRLSPLSTFRPEVSQRPPSRRGLAAGWLLCFVASVQIVFLPSIMPEILSGLRVAQVHAIRVAGLIVFAEVAGGAHGAAIGFINTSRFAANAAGPMIATAVIAHASPFGLYLSVSAFSLLALVLFLREHADAAAPLPPSKIA